MVVTRIVITRVTVINLIGHSRSFEIQGEEN